MSTSLPQNCRFNDKWTGFDFEIVVDGTPVKCFITQRAVEQEFEGTIDRVQQISQLECAHGISKTAAEQFLKGAYLQIFLNSSMLSRQRNS